MFGLRLSLGCRVEQRTKLSQAQRLETSTRTAIITPEAACPECGHKMNDEEIRVGWLDDPVDFTTECPKCKTRFEASLNIQDRKTGDLTSAPYLCELQLFTALKKALNERGRKNLGIVFLKQNEEGLLWNIIKHFGRYDIGLKAFKRWLA